MVRLNIYDHITESGDNKFDLSGELMAEILIQNIPAIKYEKNDGSISLLVFTDKEKKEFMEILGWDDKKINELRKKNKD